ncbi:MAG: hypothetical protein IPF44_03680 [Betaproteobacteria bacterium]|nr:hypothetical protein [Betaproteobacteria bacterium]
MLKRPSATTARLASGRWIESSPNQMVTGTFALSFVSEDGAALETLAADLKKAGLAVKWTLNVDRGTKSYWVHALLSDVRAAHQLPRADGLRLGPYSAPGRLFVMVAQPARRQGRKSCSSAGI